MNNYATGLEVSKLLKEKGVEIESEKSWVVDLDETFRELGDYPQQKLEYKFLGERCRCGGGSVLSLPGYDSKKYPPKYRLMSCNCPIDGFPSYSLSELAEVFKLLGEKLGWRTYFDGEYDCDYDWIDNYLKLCEVWATTQSQEKCDEFIINLLK